MGQVNSMIAPIDIFGDLVRLSETDRPFGIQAEALGIMIKLVSALDEHFLVHAVVHKAVIRFLRVCAGDEIEEPINGSRPMGAAGSSVRADPSEYELEGIPRLSKSTPFLITEQHPYGSG